MIKRIGWSRRIITRPASVTSRGGPTCGTVGCVAGWVAVLTRPDPGVVPSPWVAQSRAETVLRLSPRQADRLFSPDAVPSRYRPGTKAYVAAGVRHIEKFMRADLGYTGPKL